MSTTRTDAFDRKSEYVIQHAMVGLIAAYPILLLAVRNAMSTCFVLLLVLSLIWLLRHGRSAFSDISGKDLAFSAAMSSLFLATLISGGYHHTFQLASLDGPSRFLLVVPIYFALKSMSLPIPKTLELALPLGAFAGLATSIALPWQGPQSGTYFVDPANFGAAQSLLGILSLAAVNWTTSDSWAKLALKFVALVIGIGCAILTGERGVWIAIPVLLLLWAGFRLPAANTAVFAAAVFVAAVSSYWLIPEVNERINVSESEIVKIIDGNLETSMGQRLQIWNAATQAIIKNPIFGVGPTGAPAALEGLSENGWLTPLGLHAGLSQIHNEILANTLRLGAIGFIAIISIYFVPIYLFAKAMASGDRTARSTAIIGLLFVTGYLIFGLTFEIFNIKMFATFYSVTACVLLASANQSTTVSVQSAAAASPLRKP